MKENVKTSKPQHAQRHVVLINKLRWYLRWPCKWMIFAIVYMVVCFPYPSLLIRHFRHLSNPNALIEPDAPALQPWVAELREALPADLDPSEVLEHVEGFVIRHVPYQWDWITWGVVDYLPTVTEVIEKGQEDCDGRAVVAASLLRALGYNAWLVTDFAHMWVATDYGETMGPGRIKTVEVTEEGVRFQWAGLFELPRATAYGVAVFPPERELILVAAAWLLLLGGAGYARSATSLLLLVGGLFMIRYGGSDYWDPLLWTQVSAELAGLAAMIAAFVVMFIRLRSSTGGGSGRLV